MYARDLLLLSALVTSVAAQEAAVTAVNSAARQSGLLRLRFGTFDPLLGAPEMAPELRSPERSRLQIVQFFASPDDADREAVRRAGGEVVGYLPDNAYVVRIAHTALDELRQHRSVRWAGAYDLAFRIEPFLIDNGIPNDAAWRRYHVVVADKHRDKPALMAQIVQLGGRVDDEQVGCMIVDVTLTGPQLLQVAALDQVLWIDRWSAPENDMDNARIQFGANYVEQQGGYSGQGVNAHVYEGVESTHPDFTGGALDIQSSGAQTSHGHATAGIVWGNGTSNSQVRGMAPDCGKFYTDYGSVTGSRWQVFDELVNLREVSISTASWGNAQTTNYTSISATSDDLVFDHDLIWTQSQSNTGNQNSRPQAWAKNVFSIGAVSHGDNPTPLDDSWAAGNASIGPAADGRIKPDLCAYYDDIGTSDLTGAAGYSAADWDCCFGGTSGATPIVAGTTVLALQMYADDSQTPGVGPFGNQLAVPGGGVFANKPHFTTMKALHVVSASQYDFTAVSTDNRREHQGWGYPNLQTMWERRDVTYIVDETDVLTQGGMGVHQITVAAGEPSLKISLHWCEPGANPSAAQQLINDLSLRVTAPNGTVYWGNNGLEDGVWSVAGGSEDTVNSIENVFVDQPMAGDWIVQVLATAVVADNHVETGAVDCDYALVAVGGDGQVAPPGLFGEVSSVGFGCDGTQCTTAIYEYPSFSLSNSGLTLDLENGDYVLRPAQGTWIPPTGSTLALTDNGELIRNVGFSLPYPGGSTATIRICANGWITDGQFVGNSNIVPTPADFLQNRMWAVLWRDLNPAAGGSVWFDSSASRLVITWLGVPNFFNNGSSTFQVQFWNNGDVHYLYQNVNVQGDYLVGYNEGGVADPGSVDLSTAINQGLSICSNPTPKMLLSTTARPVIGTQFDLVTDDIPVNTLFGMMVLSLNTYPAPISLTPLGMPGCELYQPLDVSVFWTAVGASSSLPWPLPNNPALAGVEAFAQSASLTPGINAFGFAVSNGLELIVGLN